MAKAKKPAVKKSAKDESGAAKSIIESFSELSAEERIKLGPKLAAAANKDADLRSTGTEESTDHYDALVDEYNQDDEKE